MREFSSSRWRMSIWGEGRLEALGERRATSSLAELIVAWSRGFLMRDINWEYMSLDCDLLKPFFD